MYRGVSEIRQFYQSALGRLASRVLRRKIRAFLADPALSKTEASCLAVGYPLPFLDEDAVNCVAVMSAGQGLERWPRHGLCRTVLTEDYLLPFPDQSMEKILLVHAVENADYLRELMSEVWRVLAPNGRVLLVVPSRSGLWAKADRTPFGYGRPYSMKQIRQMLFDEQFIIEEARRALYFMPSHNRLLLGLAPLLEVLGAMLVPRLGGVLLVEASKKLYNVTPLRVSPLTGKPRAQAADWVTEPVPT